MKPLSYCLLLIPFHLSAQVGLNGTLPVAIVAKDGIVLAIDSKLQAQIFPSERTLFTIDRMDKTSEIDGHPILCSGRNDFDCSCIQEVLRAYDSNNDPDQDLDESLMEFATDVNAVWPANLYKGSTMFGFISGYYSKGEPVLFMVDPYTREYSQKFISTYTSFYDILPANVNQYTVAKIADSIPYWYDRFITAHKLQKHVGGPITIIKIDKQNKVTWLKNDFRKSLPTYTNITQIIIHGSNDLNTYGHTKEFILNAYHENNKDCTPHN